MKRILAVLAMAGMVAGCENPTATNDKETTEVTAQSGSTVIINSGEGGSVKVDASESQVKE
jgi:hypothetical protein